MKALRMRKANQQGFSAVVLLLIAAMIAAAGIAAWLIVDNNNSSSSPSSSPQTSDSNNINSSNKISLLAGRINLPNDGTWKIATGGYWNIETKHCGRDTGPDPACLDHKMLIPAVEEFTNPDQYQVNLLVFEREGITLSDWDQYVPEAEIQSINIGNLSGLRIAENYGASGGFKSELRITYLVQWGDKMIVAKSTFFNGNYASYQSNTDYSPYIPKYDELLRGLTIKE